MNEKCNLIKVPHSTELLMKKKVSKFKTWGKHKIRGHTEIQNKVKQQMAKWERTTEEREH